ncbi:MAG TPA: hypothetical protein VFJ70_21240 [Burkholderiales bacterium]|nr:hypothetical protein [Burkholderiales bacterium]
MKRFAALSALLLATALLAPRVALAHGDAHHSSAKEAHADRAVVLPSCPGGHGDLCSCGGPAACSASGTLAVAAAPLAVQWFVPSVRGVARRESLACGPPPAFSLRFSRAPPASS